jgi:hypothetical protein
MLISNPGLTDSSPIGFPLLSWMMRILFSEMVLVSVGHSPNTFCDPAASHSAARFVPFVVLVNLLFVKSASKGFHLSTDDLGHRQHFSKTFPGKPVVC